jgi:hypothetical protein
MFYPARANQKYCSETCYLTAKNTRSKQKYASTKSSLENAKVLANDLICYKLLSDEDELYVTNYNQLNSLGFDFSYWYDVIEDELGFAIVLKQTQIRIINSDTIQIQRHGTKL